VRAWFLVVLLVGALLVAGCGSVSVSSGGAGAGATLPATQVSAGVPASSGLGASPGSAAGSPASSVNPDDVDSSDQPSTSAQIGGSGVLSDGTTPTTIAAVDMSIILPAGWLAFDTQTAPDMLQSTSSQHPELSATLGQLQSGQLNMVAFDTTATGGGPPPIVTLVQTGDAIDVTSLLEALARTTATQIARTESISGKIDQATVKLTDLTAVELRYTLTGAAPVAVDSFLLSVGGNTWLLRFAVPAAEIVALHPAIVAAVESLAGT
jgi:hypothetical protein